MSPGYSYSPVLYTYHGQPAILKATPTEIVICDRNNRFVCKHRRSYKDFPKYITDDSQMKPEHLYYKEVNARDGAYYHRWASAYGECTSELIDHVLRSAKHEEQAYNSCAGKSYISNALCISAIRQFKTVKYIRANTMMSEMDQARIKGTYLDYVNHMASLDMLVIDDFGLMDLDLDKCRDFFEVIDSRDNLKSTVIVSQLPVKSWYDLFADNTYADACLDRIIHKAYRLELNGKNMRNPS